MKVFILILLTTFISNCSEQVPNKVNKIPDIHSENTAIVVIEFQKTWTEKGFFHKLIQKELKRNKVVDNSKLLLDTLRLRGFTVIQAPLILDKSDKEIYRKMPFIPKFFGGFTKGTWKAEYTEGIYKTTDIQTIGRCGFDACEGSNLEEILKKENVQNVLFCGFTTEHCVEMTMNTLKEKGYNCILISDCTATKSKRLQQKVEGRNLTITSKELID